jgi:hypothetical protein
MALSDNDLEGMELVSERKPEKAGGVTVSQIPAMLVKYLTAEAPKALADADHELILRVPVRPDYTGIPEITDKTSEADKAKAVAATAEADTAANKKAVETAKQLTLYAAAWGKGQTPKLYIHKVPNRKDMPANHARLAVEEWDKVPKENRPGRR